MSDDTQTGVVETFLKVLDPGDSSTGGGSASAISGAMAAALVGMAARLSVLAGDSASQTEMMRIGKDAQGLSGLLQAGSLADSRAFLAVRDAYRLPRQTDQEKALRKQAIAQAWVAAAQVPLENARHCLAVQGLGKEVASQINPKVMSDFNCALLLARAGLLGCLENVAINLPSLQDVELARQLSAQAAELRSRSDVLADVRGGMDVQSIV